MRYGDYSIATIKCSHCPLTMFVHVRLSDGIGMFPTSDPKVFSSVQEVLCVGCGKAFHVADVPPIIGEPFVLTGLEADIMKQIEKNEGSMLDSRLADVLKVPIADIDAALRKLNAAGHLRQSDFFGRVFPVRK
jgi:hypothetical protein